MTFWDVIGNSFYNLSQDFLTIPRLFCLAALVVGYFCGMFQSAFFISKAMHVDIYSQGSGNPGTTNMLRVLGPLPGLLTFILDIGKTVGAIFLAQYIFLTWLQMPIDPLVLKLYTGLGVILGHNFPVYLQGRGGKGVAVTCTIYVLLGEWKYIVVGLLVFLLIFLITRFVSLASMVTLCVLMFEFLFCTLMDWTHVSPAFLIDADIIVIIYSVLVLATHHKNIMRLLYEEEPRFRFRKSKRQEKEPEEEPDEDSGVEFYYADTDIVSSDPNEAIAEKLEYSFNKVVDEAQLAIREDMNQKKDTEQAQHNKEEKE